MEIVLVWLLLAALVGAYASSKGHSALGLFLLSALLSPLLGLIIELLRSPAAVGDVKKCPACAELIKLEAVKCRYCGEAVPISERANPSEKKAGM